MDDFRKSATKSSPEVTFEAATGTLRLSGASYPENAFAFYKPALDWLREYLAVPGSPVRLEIDLKYMNSSSIKSLMNMARMLEALPDRETRARIHWVYDPNDLTTLEVAEDFRDGLDLPFVIEPK